MQRIADFGTVQRDGHDVAVTLDQHKFKQVLYNLLSNAVKFCARYSLSYSVSVPMMPKSSEM